VNSIGSAVGRMRSRVGHALAIAVAIALAIAAGAVLPSSALRWPVAGMLIALGIRRLVRHRHPRCGSMRIGRGRLAMWSFLVATAHGAGLMVLPVWLGTAAMSPAGHGAHIHGTVGLGSGLVAAMVHSSSYLLVTTVIAWIVFTRLGVTAWWPLPSNSANAAGTREEALFDIVGRRLVAGRCILPRLLHASRGIPRTCTLGRNRYRVSPNACGSPAREASTRSEHVRSGSF